MHLLLLALACEITEPASEGTDTGNPADTAAEDTAETGDTFDTDTDDTADTDTATGDDADADGYLAPEDCDDTNAAIHPGVAETCDGVDENCDGSIDEGSASVGLLVEGPGDGSISSGLWYGYDADDREVLVASDPELDGVLNNYTRSEWENGLLVASERSVDGVTVYERIDYMYDVDGNITDVHVDGDGDGVVDYSYGYTYTDGVYTSFWYDLGNDGVYEQAYGYEFNSYGYQTYYWSDSDGDGDYDQERIYTYDEDHLVSASMDEDGDDVFEVSQTNTWEGDRMMEELVVGGPWAYRRSYAYTDADDFWDTSDYDIGDDGSIDYRFTQTWDTDGTITGQTSDQYADGVDVYEGVYEVDADGNIRNSSYMDGVLTSVWEYEYHDSGALAVLRSDQNGDGLWEWVQSYDNAAHLIEAVGDYPTSDGVIDSIQTWSYDERSRRLGATTDALGDGTFEYEQWPIDGYACGVK